MAEILLETNCGIKFERTDYKKRSKVVVRTAKGYNAMTYRFNCLKDKTFSSPYISWENLNCCNGWMFDSSYLLSAVQEGQKICAGISFDTLEESQAYISKYGNDYNIYAREPSGSVSKYWYNVEIALKGKISDFINLDDVEEYYYYLDQNIASNLDFNAIRDLCDINVLNLINGNVGFQYYSLKSQDEMVVAGLLLGYPIQESTISIIGGY